jgi:adenosine deaminase
MTEGFIPSTQEDYIKIPKVDLHRHLEGSLRVSTMLEIAAQEGISLPSGQAFERLVQVQKDEPQSFKNFLSKFDTLRKFFTSQSAIERYTREAVADAALDGIIHLELTFTPVALSRLRGYEMGEIMDLVAETAQTAAGEFGINVRLIASANRHEDPGWAAEVAELAVQKQDKGITGLGLVGNEAEFPAEPFYDSFLAAKRAGLSIVIHAGEWGGAENVREAIEVFEADRIAHGVRVFESPDVVDLARQSGIPFEVCITSNCQSGVVASCADHPVKKMLDAGLKVTLNTDDPGISNITLSHEYALAAEYYGFTHASLHACTQDAVYAAFIDDSLKKDLLEKIVPGSFGR